MMQVKDVERLMLSMQDGYLQAKPRILVRKIRGKLNATKICSEKDLSGFDTCRIGETLLRKSLSYLVVLVFASCVLFGLFSFEGHPIVGSESSLPVHNIDTGLDYATIQEAVDANETVDGHTILVDPGTYTELSDILIYKSLIIRGSGNQNTVLNLTKVTPGLFGMQIAASNVLLEGFTMTAQSDGGLVYVYGSLSGHPWTEPGLPICTNVTIRGNIFVGAGSDALVLRNTERSRVLNNSFFSTSEAFGLGSGIGLLTSNFNTVSNNTIHGGWAGIVCQWGASNNTIVYNTITDEVQREGLGGAVAMAEFPHGNVFAANNLTGNEVAVWFATLAADPSNNTFYHNNFINNGLNIQDDEGIPNAWDAGYPVGGNYWSDYSGNDTCSGPNQDQPGSDGFGDTPRVINENCADRYPLTMPYISPCGDISLDGVVDIIDALRLASAFGSHPGFEKWNTLADLVPDDSIDIYDAIALCHNFGERGRQ